MKTMDVVAGVMLGVGGVSWGLAGVLDFNPVSAVLGSSGLDSVVYGFAAAVYGLVALGALWHASARPARRRWAALRSTR